MLIESIPTAVSGGAASAGEFDLIKGLQLANELIGNIVKLKNVTGGSPMPEKQPAIQQSKLENFGAPSMPVSSPVIKSRCDHILEMVESILQDMVSKGRGDEKVSETLLKVNPTIAEVFAILRAVK